MKPTNSPWTNPVDSLVATRPDISATVSASAGTGKTWLLVTRIIRLLLADTEPGSILSLTFSRKRPLKCKCDYRSAFIGTDELELRNSQMPAEVPALLLLWSTQMQRPGVCAVELPIAKKWHGEDSFLFF